jgi:plasmid stabilization system protein ParE
MSSYHYSSDANSDIEEIALYIFDLNSTFSTSIPLPPTVF